MFISLYRVHFICQLILKQGRCWFIGCINKLINLLFGVLLLIDRCLRIILLFQLPMNCWEWPRRWILFSIEIIVNILAIYSPSLYVATSFHLPLEIIVIIQSIHVHLNLVYVQKTNFFFVGIFLIWFTFLFLAHFVKGTLIITFIHLFVLQFFEIK